MNRKLYLYSIPMLLALVFGAFAQDAPKDKDARGIDVVGRPGATQAERGDFWLIVIGINEYINFPKLATAVNDAQEVKKVLLERYGFETKRLIELYDADATAKRIYSELRSLSGRIKPDDSLLIYYAGHGNLDEITKSGAWIPVDGARDDPTTWLDNDALKKYLNVDAIKARHILLISDSCFAGDFFARGGETAPKITDAYVRTAFGKTSREAITSGGKEPVSDKGFANHSVFAHFLLKALQENTEPYLLPSAVHERVKGGVSQNARQQTQYGLLTGAGGELGGSFVLFLKGAGKDFDEIERQKQQQLSQLSKAEADMKAQNEAVAAEDKARQAKIDDMDRQIREMQKKLGASGQGDSSTLDQIVAMVEQKERQARELAEMRRKAEAERKQREQEIARLKAEEQNKQIETLNADIAKYQKVAGSEYGKDLRDSAWNALLEKWGLQKGSVPVGNISSLCKMLNLAPPASAGFVEVGINQQGYKEYRHAATGMVFVLIAGAATAESRPNRESFQMGSNDGEADEKPVHEVTLNSFLIAKYEVTQAQWQKIMGNNPAKFKGDNNPVEQVSWDDCQSFCQKAGLRLPTEAEWEYACRGITHPVPSGHPSPRNNRDSVATPQEGTKYYWGNEANGDYMWYSANSGNTTHPVGQKRPNGFGLYDMSGNVWEWCQDWYGNYGGNALTNPTGPASGQYRVLRGGSWVAYDSYCRAAVRYRDVPGYRFYSCGLRCVAPIK